MIKVLLLEKRLNLGLRITSAAKTGPKQQDPLPKSIVLLLQQVSSGVLHWMTLHYCHKGYLYSLTISVASGDVNIGE